MNVIQAITQRRSIRGFLPKPVEWEKIERILDTARWAPSGANAQPWQVAVVMGETKRRLQQRMVEAFQTGGEGQMDYRYYPEKWEEPYLGRRRACGLQLYTALGVGREETERRRQLWAANYRAFDAPAVLFLFLDRSLAAGSFFDCGMFLQSVMLAALEEGLATCPQAALGQYASIVRESLGYADDCVLVCGLAIGYADPQAPINSYRTPREPVEAFARFFE